MIKVKYGYVRVSTKEQNIDRQMSALIEANLSIENISENTLSSTYNLFDLK